MMDLLAELRWRGLLQDATPGLDAHLREPRVAYCGFDPTAPSLQLGNLVPVMLLRHLQRAGHTPIVLMGGGTGLIGDPSGKSSERPLLARDELRANLERQRAQFARFLDFGSRPSRAVIRDNAEWLEPAALVTFLRDVGKHFTVNVMLQKESVKARLDGGLSYTEFSYMLLQAYDFLELYRREKCTIQVGGSDQWGNITAGADLIRRAVGGEAHALVAPLVTAPSGAKFGKTEAGAIYLDAAMTSPYKFYQYWINVDDRDVEAYLKVFTDKSQNEISDLVARKKPATSLREAQGALAKDMTILVHGVAVASTVISASSLLFSGFDPQAADDKVFDTLSKEIPTAHTNETAPKIVDAFVLTSLAKSKSEARRAIEQGGAYVNQQRVDDPDRAISAEEWLAGRNILLRKGKKGYALLRRA